MNSTRLLMLFLLAMLMIGCGQIGPLYLPDEAHPVEKHK